MSKSVGMVQGEEERAGKFLKPRHFICPGTTYVWKVLEGAF